MILVDAIIFWLLERNIEIQYKRIATFDMNKQKLSRFSAFKKALVVMGCEVIVSYLCPSSYAYFQTVYPLS